MSYGTGYEDYDSDLYDIDSTDMDQSGIGSLSRGRGGSRDEYEPAYDPQYFNLPSDFDQRGYGGRTDAGRIEGQWGWDQQKIFSDITDKYQQKMDAGKYGWLERSDRFLNKWLPRLEAAAPSHGWGQFGRGVSQPDPATNTQYPVSNTLPTETDTGIDLAIDLGLMHRPASNTEDTANNTEDYIVSDDTVLDVFSGPVDNASNTLEFEDTPVDSTATVGEVAAEEPESITEWIGPGLLGASPRGSNEWDPSDLYIPGEEEGEGTYSFAPGYTFGGSEGDLLGGLGGSWPHYFENLRLLSSEEEIGDPFRVFWGGNNQGYSVGEFYKEDPDLGLIPEGHGGLSGQGRPDPTYLLDKYADVVGIPSSHWTDNQWDAYNVWRRNDFVDEGPRYYTPAEYLSSLLGTGTQMDTGDVAYQRTPEQNAFLDRWLPLLQLRDPDTWGDPSGYEIDIDAKMDQFSEWVGAGPQDWTPEQWAVYSELVGADGYGDDRITIEDEFSDLLVSSGLAGSPEEAAASAYWAYRNDPRFWEFMQTAAGDAGLGGITDIGGYEDADSTWTQDEMRQLGEMIGPDGIAARTPDELKYDAATGAWTYEPPPSSIESPGWGDTADTEAAYVSHLESIWDDTRNPRDLVNWQNAKEEQQLRAAFREVGLSTSLVDAIVQRVRESGGSLLEDPFVKEFMGELFQYGELGYTPETPQGHILGLRPGEIDPRLEALLGEMTTGEDAPNLTTAEVAAWLRQDPLDRIDILTPSEPTDIESFAEMFPDNPDAFWVYGPEYRQWLLSRPEFADGWDQDLRDELAKFEGNEGQRRPGAPGRFDIPDETSYDPTIDYGDATGWTGPSATLPGYGDLNPFLLGGLGAYAPGNLFGRDTSWMDDPWASSWGLPSVDYGDFGELSEEDKNLFLQADDFFAWVKNDAEERGLLDEETGEFDLHEYFTVLRNEDAANADSIENQYYYWGNEWDRIAPMYYPAAQDEVRGLLASPARDEMLDSLSNSLLPLAPHLSELLNRAGLNYSVDEVISILSGATSYEGEGVTTDDSESASAEADAGINNVNSSPGTTEASESLDTQDAVDSADNVSTGSSASADVNREANSFKPSVSDAFTNDFSVVPRSTGVEKNEAVSLIHDDAYASAKVGGLTGPGRRDQVQIPNFVMDAAASGTASMDPVSYWMGLSSSDRDTLIGMADEQDLDTGMRSYANPESDLYRTDSSTDTTKFYLPAWAIDMAYPATDSEAQRISDLALGQEYQGVVPDYAWWQSIGAGRRLDIQNRAASRGMDTDLIAMRKLIKENVDGKDVPRVHNAMDFKYENGVLTPQFWEEESEDLEISKYTVSEPVGFADFIKWMIDRNPDLDPQKVFDVSDGRTRGSVGLEAAIENTGNVGGKKGKELHWGVGENAPTRYGQSSPDTRSASHGAFSKTAWNYFLDNFDEWAQDPTKIPLPESIIGDFSDIETKKGIVSYGGGYRMKPKENRGDHFPGYTYEEGEPTVLSDLSFDIVEPVSDYGVIADSDHSFSMNMDEFFSAFTEQDADGEYEYSVRNLIDDDTEGWDDYGGEAANRKARDLPLYYDDGSSAQAMFGAISLFAPFYYEYLTSHDKSVGSIDAPSFSQYLNSSLSGKKPEFDKTNLPQTSAAALAFQQKALVDYQDLYLDRSALADWSGNIVKSGVGYTDYSGGSFLDQMFYGFDMSHKIPAPSHGMAAGGIVGIGYQEGGPIPPPQNEGIASMAMPVNQPQLESLVQSDPLLQEVVNAIMGSHPDAQRIIQMAIAKYGEEIIAALSRMIQASSGSQTTYVPGSQGGMDDDVPALIDGAEPAKLSSGEFVIPSDVVSHLGDGNNENGASKLHGMMDRVRVDKTGNVEQPEEIVDEEVLPA